MSRRIRTGTISGEAMWFSPWLPGSTFVSEPLDRLGRTNRPEAAFDALDHEAADHLAGDASGGGNPANDFAVVAN